MGMSIMLTLSKKLRLSPRFAKTFGIYFDKKMSLFCDISLNPFEYLSPFNP